MELIFENGKTYLKGIFTECNFGLNESGMDFSFRPRNRNGRLYSYDVLKEAVLSLIEIIKKEPVLSYRNHPSHSDLVYEDSAAKIVELVWEDVSGRAIGKVEILQDTKHGKQVLEDIANGIEYGISTRALGSLDENKMVKKGLNIITADLIPVIREIGSIQSCQSCSLSLTESIQVEYNDYLIGESLEDNKEVPCGCIYTTLDNENKKIAENYLIESFKKCLMQI